jgi:hypothetical protein
MEDKMKKALMAIGILALLISCEGDRGPAGPQGAQGEPGPGTRTVYLSTFPIPTDDLYTVDIPEIQLSDMPLVSVYITLAGYDLWYELPAYFENYPDWGQICFFTEGHVTFEWCEGFNYKIVIVE